MMIPSDKTLTVGPWNPGIRKGRNVWIRTAAGPHIGFGHLRRCLILARRLQDEWLPLFLLDREDHWSIEQVTDANWSYCARDLDEAWSVMSEPACILMDTRQTAGLTRLIGRARDRGIPVVSIHDLGLSPLPSDVVIDGSIAPGYCEALPREASRYTGTDFMILDPAYGRIHRRKKQIRDTIRSVYINLGGGDSEALFLRILQGLKLWSRELEVIGVAGFIPRGEATFGAQDWSPLRLRWESAHIEHFLSEADIAITAGGLAAYEALCAGTPPLSLAYDSLQQITVGKLAGAGACIDLGPGNTLDAERLCEILARVDSNVDLRRRLSARGKEMLDGRGAERVTEIIRQTIHMHMMAGSGRLPSVAGIGI